MNRRDFLKTALIGAAGAASGLLSLPVGANQSSDAVFWGKPRVLRLHRAQTGEHVETVYWAENALVADGYLKICALLRDTHQNLAYYIDPHLLDLMVAVQAYVEFYGYKSPITINSGYRTAKTNSSLEGAAKNSLHMQGRAIDFSIPGLPSTYIGLLASYYKGGGVGFYPNSGFTHMDTGSVRYWIKQQKSWRPS